MRDISNTLQQMRSHLLDAKMMLRTERILRQVRGRLVMRQASDIVREWSSNHASEKIRMATIQRGTRLLRRALGRLQHKEAVFAVRLWWRRSHEKASMLAPLKEETESAPPSATVEDPREWHYVKLKQYMLAEGAPKEEVDACFDQEDLIRLFEQLRPPPLPSVDSLKPHMIKMLCRRMLHHRISYAWADFYRHYCLANDESQYESLKKSLEAKL